MPLSPGTRLGRYEVVRLLGAGGMGEVYLAKDERLQREVALKVLPTGTLADEASRRRFRNEAMALSKLDHQNIETVYDFDTQEGVDFLIMQYIPGETLDAKLATGPLAEKEVARLGTQIAEGLAAAHTQGVIHRDLKPGNLLVTPDGRMKLLDFGLAKLLPSVGEMSRVETATDSHAVSGTLPYMAPEQLRGETVDARTDIFALGAVLYEMATGKRPFREESSPRLTDAILHQAPVTPRAVNARVSPELERIILKSLEKDPTLRYQSATDVGVDLRRLGTPSGAGAISPAVSPGSKWPAMGVMAALGGAAVLVLLIGLNVGGLRERLFGGTSASRIESLAVLPLENLSGDPEQEYFADGMTDALITDLSKISALKVISRTSSMRYKSKDRPPLPEIAQQLGVDALIEGSVLRVGDRVRITAQLIEAATDQHLWAENYERDFVDVLALQSEVARAIAEEIKVALTPEEEARLGKTGQVDPEAYQAYLRGLDRVARAVTEEELRLAIEMFKRAVEQDPDFALAHAELSMAHSFYYHLGHDRTNERRAMAKRAADRAAELAPDSPQIHLALGYYRYYGHQDYEQALDEFAIAERALPNSFKVLGAVAYIRRRQGRWDEHLVKLEKAFELNPLDADIAMNLGQTYQTLRKYADAARWLQRCISLAPDWTTCYTTQAGVYRRWKGTTEEARAVLELMPQTYTPEFTWAWSSQEFLERKYQAALDRLSSFPSDPLYGGARKPRFLAAVYDALDEPQQARSAYETALVILEKELLKKPDDYGAISFYGIALAGVGRKDEAIREGKRAVELLPVSKDAYSGPNRLQHLARIYMMVGEHDAALDQLEYLLSIPSRISVPYLRLDPRWKPLWDHPRFKEIEERFANEAAP